MLSLYPSTEELIERGLLETREYFKDRFTIFDLPAHELEGKVLPTLLDRQCPACHCDLSSHGAHGPRDTERCYGIRHDHENQAPVQSGCDCKASFPKLHTWYGRLSPYSLLNALVTYEKGHAQHFGYILELFAPELIKYDSSFTPPLKAFKRGHERVEEPGSPYPRIPLELYRNNPRYIKHKHSTHLGQYGCRNLLEDYGDHTSLCPHEPCLCGYQELLDPGNYGNYRKGYSGLLRYEPVFPEAIREPRKIIRDGKAICYACLGPWTGTFEHWIGDHPDICAADHKPPRMGVFSNCCKKQISEYFGYGTGTYPKVGFSSSAR